MTWSDAGMTPPQEETPLHDSHDSEFCENCPWRGRFSATASAFSHSPTITVGCCWILLHLWVTENFWSFQASWKEQAIPNSKWGQAYAEGRNSVASVSLFYCILESNDTINGKGWTSGIIARTWSNWVTGHVMTPVSMTSYENYWKDVQRNNISVACTNWFCQWTH